MEGRGAKQRGVFCEAARVSPKNSGKNSVYCIHMAFRYLSSISLGLNPRGGPWVCGIFFQVPLCSGLGSSSIFLQIRVPLIPGKGGSCHSRDGADPLHNTQVQRGNCEGNLMILVGM